MTGIICALPGVIKPAAVISRTAKTVTASGNAQVDTAQSKFGGASALFDGSGDYLTVSPVGTDLYFPAGQNVTIEMWIRPNIALQFNPFFALGNARGASSGELSFYIESFSLLQIQQKKKRICYLSTNVLSGLTSSF